MIVQVHVRGDGWFTQSVGEGATYDEALDDAVARIKSLKRRADVTGACILTDKSKPTLRVVK